MENAEKMRFKSLYSIFMNANRCRKDSKLHYNNRKLKNLEFAWKSRSITQLNENWTEIFSIIKVEIKPFQFKFPKAQNWPFKYKPNVYEHVDSYNKLLCYNLLRVSLKIRWKKNQHIQLQNFPIYKDNLHCADRHKTQGYSVPYTPFSDGHAYK